MPKKKRYKLLKSTHKDENGKLYRKGDTVESATDLIAMFGPEKFAIDGVFVAATVPDDEEEEEAPSENELEAEPEEGESTSVDEATPDDQVGTDVTDDFADAEDAEVTVRKHKRKYYIYDADGALLRSELATKKEVKEHIESMFEDDEEEEEDEDEDE